MGFYCLWAFLGEFMRSNQRLVKTIAAVKPVIRQKYGVERIGFTNWWTNQKLVTSDLTIVVELNKPLGWQFYALKSYLESKLQLHIDLTTMEGIKPIIREEVESLTRFV